MLDQFPTYLFTKRRVYYYSCRIPRHMRSIYGKQRLVISRETSSHSALSPQTISLAKESQVEGAQLADHISKIAAL
jgi:hypothetical protein